MEFNGTFLVTIISFLVFVFVMNKILYTPILNIMEERKSFVDGNYKAVEENDNKTNELSTQKQEKLDNAKDDAREKYNTTVDEFKSQKAEVISDAQNSVNEELNRSKAELEHLSNEVKDGLKASMTDLANDIVEKVIGYRSEVQGFDNDAVNRVLWGE